MNKRKSRKKYQYVAVFKNKNMPLIPQEEEHKFSFRKSEW